jgi:hypothetical protein
MALMIESLGAAALELQVQGTLRKNDYQQFVPLAETRIKENGTISLLVRVSGLGGISARDARAAFYLGRGGVLPRATARTG